MNSIALDPLIAEAQRRARRRRLLLLAAGLITAAAMTASLALRSPERPRLAVAPPACRTAQLRLSLARKGVAAGSVGETFSFTNTSSSTCVLSGWPGFRLVMPGGRTVTARPHDLVALAYSTAHPPPLPRVRLDPGASSRWFLQETDGCSTSKSVLVTPPGTRRQIAVSARLSFCGARAFWALPVGRGS